MMFDGHTQYMPKSGGQFGGPVKDQNGVEITGGAGTSDHGALTGLSDDDHSQYHNNTRGDARYSLLAHNHTGTYEPANANIQSHISSTSNPHSVDATDVGLGNVDNTSNATERAATATLTNKRITKRIGTTASSATPTPDADAHDQYNVTALAADATFGAPSGTPTDGQTLIIRVKDNGTARALAYNAIYRAIGVTLPTTTTISKTLYLGARFNAADTKWDVLASANEA